MLTAAKFIGAGLFCSGLILSCGEFITKSPLIISCGEFIINNPLIIGCGITILPLTLYYGMSEEVINMLKNAGKVVGLAIASGTAVGTSNAISSDKIRQYREAKAKEAQSKLEEEKAKLRLESQANAAKVLTEEMKKFHKPK